MDGLDDQQVRCPSAVLPMVLDNSLPPQLLLPSSGQASYIPIDNFDLIHEELPWTELEPDEERYRYHSEGSDSDTEHVLKTPPSSPPVGSPDPRIPGRFTVARNATNRRDVSRSQDHSQPDDSPSLELRMGNMKLSRPSEADLNEGVATPYTKAASVTAPSPCPPQPTTGLSAQEPRKAATPLPSLARLSPSAPLQSPGGMLSQPHATPAPATSHPPPHTPTQFSPGGVTETSTPSPLSSWRAASREPAQEQSLPVRPLQENLTASQQPTDAMSPQTAPPVPSPATPVIHSPQPLPRGYSQRGQPEGWLPREPPLHYERQQQQTPSRDPTSSQHAQSPPSPPPQSASAFRFTPLSSTQSARLGYASTSVRSSNAAQSLLFPKKTGYKISTDDPDMSAYLYTHPFRKPAAGTTIWYASRSDAALSHPPALINQVLNAGDLYIHFKFPPDTMDATRQCWVYEQGAWKDITTDSNIAKSYNHPTLPSRSLHFTAEYGWPSWVL